MQNIRIIVNGKDLVLRSDTTLSMEMNNALFADDAIEGDVVYQFEVPVAGNEVTLGFSHLPYTRNSRRFDCTVLIGGVNMISGRLVVQDVTATAFQVAVLFNPYPDGFGNKMLNSCTSEEFVISDNLTKHKDNWKEFLKKSLSEGSDVKFSPFINEEAYGDDNAGFGMWHGRSVEKLVNRLFWQFENSLVEHRTLKPFVELFCDEYVFTNEESKDVTKEWNQFSWCPQIRVSAALAMLVAESGYCFVDHINDELKRVFLQGAKALDGSKTDYDNVKGVRLQAVSVPAGYKDRWGNSIRGGFFTATEAGCSNDDDMLKESYSGNDAYGIKFPYAGQYRVRISATFFSAHKSKLYFAVMPAGIVSRTLDDALYYKDLSTRLVDQRNDRDKRKTGNPYDSATPYKIDEEFEVTIPSTATTPLYYVNLYYRLNGGDNVFDVQYSLDDKSKDRDHAELEIESLDLEKGLGLNIFANKYRLADLMPKVSNSAFLTTMMRTLGLCYFADNKSRQIELISLPEMMKAGSLDLSSYVLTRETELAMPEMKKYGVSLDSLESADIDADVYIGEYDTFWRLPDPKKHLNKKAFVRNLNAYYAAVQVEDKDSSWRVEWQRCSGNNRKMTVGSGEESEKKLDAIIPWQETRFFTVLRDGVIIANMNIPFRMQSSIYPADETSDKVFLMYYRGPISFNDHSAYKAFKFEDMRPVVPGEFSLTTTGENSLGEKYIKPWMKLNYTARTVTYKLRVPVLKALEIMRLIQPQRELPANQVRFVMVDNVKSVPKKITFEASVTSDMLLCEIEAAALE